MGVTDELWGPQMYFAYVDYTTSGLRCGVEGEGFTSVTVRARSGLCTHLNVSPNVTGTTGILSVS